MNRKKFLKTTGCAVIGAGLAGLSACSRSEKKQLDLVNWAGNLQYHAGNIIYPSSPDEIQKAVKSLPIFKTLGSRHSFSTIADTSGTLIATDRLDKIIGLNEEKNLVWCESGVRYGTLAVWLDNMGYALHNLASLPHISVAGACMTATHGSGDRCGNLSSAVRAFEFITPAGEVIQMDQSHPDFYGAVVNLGAIGVVTKIALAIQPTFQVAQFVFEDLSMDLLRDNFDAIFQSGYSVSLFTHWTNRKINQVWVKRRLDESYDQSLDEFFGTKPAKTHLHPIKVNSPVNCTDQMGIPGKWFERLPHFKMGFTPSNGAELQTEFFVPRDRATQAIFAVESLQKQITPALFVTEIRSIAADELWMSPAYKQDVVAIHFTWKPLPEQVMAVIPEIQNVLAAFNAIPHWGKIATWKATELSSRLPRFGDFKNLVRKYDPSGKLKNDFLNEKIFG
jgi:xylitol oxidase